MELIGAGLGDHVDDRTREVAVLGVKGAGLQPEFLDGIEHWYRARSIRTVVLDNRSIHHESIGVFTLTIDREQAGSQIAGCDDGGLEWTGVANRGDAGLQAEKVEIAAPVQRERNDLAVLDHIAHGS